MASAILTVLWPDEFTVYDSRVCGQLRDLGAPDFSNLAHTTVDGKRWAGYQEFVLAVKANAPAELSLRDKDRWLWARSAAEQVQADVKRGFPKREDIVPNPRD